MVQQLREIPLAQDLVHTHSYTVGQVQAAAGIPHGHPDAVLLIGRQQCLRQAGILPPEHKVGPVRVLDVGVALGRLVVSSRTGLCSGQRNPPAHHSN